MQRQIDFLIVGAGLFGATCAYELSKKGFRCLVIEKRSHIGGNCFTELRDGINVHKYGPHIFHTSNRIIWDWINQFADFNHYQHRVKINSEGKIYSLPLNLLTFHQLWGVETPEQAKAHLDQVRLKQMNTETLEGWLCAQVGREVYEKFFRGYSEKQWGQSPAQLPASIVKRLPIRFSFDDNYFDDPFQGIPIGGYTGIFLKLFAEVDVRLDTDYFDHRHYFDSLARRVLYTGPIDRFFNYRFGKLSYRSMRFEHSRIETPDFQGVAQMNYGSEKIPFTRIVEHKHFEFGKQPMTWITKEFPASSGEGLEPMYPVKDVVNEQIWHQYKLLSEKPEYRKYYFGGRLAAYQYYDMHQVIGAAFARLKAIEGDLSSKPREQLLQAV